MSERPSTRHRSVNLLTGGESQVTSGILGDKNECDRPFCRRQTYGKYCSRHGPPVSLGNGIDPQPPDRDPDSGRPPLQNLLSDTPDEAIGVCTDCERYFEPANYEFCPLCGDELLTVEHGGDRDD